ncbi:MAG: OmpA family protein [Elusimicrobiota bacterium]
MKRFPRPVAARRPPANASGFRRLLLCALFSSPWPAAAELDHRSRWSVGIEAGRAFPVSPSEFSQPNDSGPGYGARLRQDLTERWSAAAVFSSQSFRRKEQASQKTVTQPLMFMGFLSLARTASWNPYLAGGLGFSRNQRTVFSVRHHWTKLTGALGAGVEYTLSPVVSVGVEGLYRYFPRPSIAEKAFQTATASALINFYIPDSWIPDRPRRPLVIREAPPAIPEPPAPTPQEQAQAELNRVQEDMFSKKISSIRFETGQAVLLESSYETLDIVGTILRRYPELGVRVVGHTDEVGGDMDNKALSAARAEAVRQYLVENFSLPAEKIATAGMGETQPVADNTTEEGKAMNRRVEFLIIK